jgi:vitamin K-dependent gamma-carboxylase
MDFASIRKSLGTCVDASSCIVFRIAFGGTIAYWAWDYLADGTVTRRYVEPKFHSTYAFFDFVKPLPGQGMYWVFLAVLFLGLLVAAGAFYRVTSVLLAALFTYIFLLDRTNYQNHYYLICLVAWWMPFLGLQRMVSVDAWRRPSLLDEGIPRWVLVLLQFHVGLPYFMGGIAKLIPDWLLGFPMNEMIQSLGSMPLIGRFASWEGAGLVIAWAGLLFDLGIVPLLLIRRTRILAYVLCLLFHLTNSVVFNIHIFPWFMMLATTIFFDPTWPRLVLASGQPVVSPTRFFRERPVANWLIALMGCYMLFHVVWPLRHHLYGGDTSWHEQGHYFSWRMMLRGKRVVMGFAIKDTETKVVMDGNPNRYINADQKDKLGRDPEMILQFAHFLRDEYTKDTGHGCEIYALVLVSLNGRKPQLMIDPNVDLAQESRGLHTKKWILPQNEPLRWPPWSLPPETWREHVQIPELVFLNKSPTQPATKDE